MEAYELQESDKQDVHPDLYSAESPKEVGESSAGFSSKLVEDQTRIRVH